MGEVVFCCRATGREFVGGFQASREDLLAIPATTRMRLCCAICGNTHEFDFAQIRLCECPHPCRDRKDCQRCGFAKALT